MDENWIQDILLKVSRNELTPDEAFQSLKNLPYESLGGFATLDHHRSIRTGFSEVIFAQGKTPEQIIAIFNHLAEHNRTVLVTRLAEEVYLKIKDEIPAAKYHPLARTLLLDRVDSQQKKTGICVLTAGTADIPVAEEAAITAEAMGNQVQRVFDVGVAGLHRLLGQSQVINQAKVLIVVAGMEGALPSVVAGLASAPVIAVPTSVGYGANFNGLAPLLAMLNSCANGVAVVNIDNGFGAGVMASMINRQSI